MYYVRKISRGRWPEEKKIAEATLKDIEADTVTTELKTNGNTLSRWQADNDTELDEAFVALASNMKQIGAISAVKIEESQLKDYVLEKELGQTPATEINERHRNITGLNYVNLSGVIQAVLDSLGNQGMVRKSKQDMRMLLVNAYKGNKLNTSLMPTELREEIEKIISNG